MANRKLFRMKHEPCSGRCYAAPDVFGLAGLGLDVVQTAKLLHDLISIHEPACGREQIAFAMDVDEDAGIFVGVFTHFGETETVTATKAVDCITAIIEAAQQWYATERAQKLLADNPGDGKHACEHGKDHDLAAFALRHSGLSGDEQAEVMRVVSAQLVA